MSIRVKAFPVKQVSLIMLKCIDSWSNEFFLRVLDIKRYISYATWAEVDEQQAHRARIFTVHQRVRNPVIELAEIRQAHYLPIRSLDFYWFTDCLRVVRILTIEQFWNTYAKLTSGDSSEANKIKFLPVTSEKIRSLVKVTFFRSLKQGS